MGIEKLERESSGKKLCKFLLDVKVFTIYRSQNVVKNLRSTLSIALQCGCMNRLIFEMLRRWKKYLHSYIDLFL